MHNNLIMINHCSILLTRFGNAEFSQTLFWGTFGGIVIWDHNPLPLEGISQHASQPVFCRRFWPPLWWPLWAQPRKGSRCRSRSRFLLCSKFFRVRHGMHWGKALHPNARLLRLNQDIKSTPSPLQRSVPECSSLSPNLLGNVAGNVDKQI